MLNIITHYNGISNTKDARNILIIYYEEKMFVGDSYILINHLSFCNSIFPDASLDINCCNKKYTPLCAALLKNNPYIRSFNNTDWEEIDYSAYDIVLCIMQDESRLLHVLQTCYERHNTWTTAVYSMTAQFINTALNPVLVTVFPPLMEIIGEQIQPDKRQRELYITPEEKEWANNWLREKGVKEHEQLFIVIDATSDRQKLLNMDTYNDVLFHLLDQDAVKVLIYDELDMGKESFYRNWIGEEKLSKMIFAVKLGLRNDICLLASDYTRLVFGPCTGMIHCASGVYNFFLRNGMPASAVPSILTYTGRYIDDHDTAFHWWGTSPLVKCLIIRAGTDNSKEVVVLQEIPEAAQKDASQLMFCNSYTADDIIGHLPSHQHALII